MNTFQKYHGVVVPMITPVDQHGMLDVTAVRIIIRFFVKHGVSPLLMGTTGEGNSVAADQGVLFVKTAAEAANKQITIYAGLTGCCVSEQFEAAAKYKEAGADVIVATLPSYYALTDEQMYQYYKQLADNSALPVMLYNIKATTHMTIPVDVVKRLSAHPNIVGLKDSERDIDRMSACLEISRNNPKFSYFCGWAAKSSYCLQQGADGIVPSTGNFVPELFAKLYDEAVNGSIDAANQLQEETDRIARIYQEGRTLGESLAALKVMMGTKALCQPYMLAPLTPLTDSEKEQVIQQTITLKQS
ncbi:dihydrodipicolinate synthase family protein [Bacteroides sp. 214]|uniref:dihydrodipicolinate synthase family protein n=1 Tax=Bacteroides sp. 214 TaxID=2302935 RepID=UPI0013D58B28|nr:dihydrodipicolinate synthase family protein [Bacteroides sp. 214]NDW12416.1 dihydrodipicolinate synthase family protein [Bacteroides sp. 214]